MNHNEQKNRWLNEDLFLRFKKRVLIINMEEMNKRGEIFAAADKNGKTLPAICKQYTLRGIITKAGESAQSVEMILL